MTERTMGLNSHPLRSRMTIVKKASMTFKATIKIRKKKEEQAAAPGRKAGDPLYRRRGQGRERRAVFFQPARRGGVEGERPAAVHSQALPGKVLRLPARAQQRDHLPRLGESRQSRRDRRGQSDGRFRGRQDAAGGRFRRHRRAGHHHLAVADSGRPGVHGGARGTYEDAGL